MNKTKKIKIDYNSAENQEIKGKLVEREVKACFSYEMDAILKATSGNRIEDLPVYDEIENLYQYVCPECGSGYKEESEAKSCCDSEKEPEQEPQEILEWWIVTEWLAKKLSAKNEPVLDWGNNWYWGRTCSGQAIMLDGVISEICEDMEILEGQKYSWADKK